MNRDWKFIVVAVLFIAVCCVIAWCFIGCASQPKRRTATARIELPPCYSDSVLVVLPDSVGYVKVIGRRNP